VPSLVTSLPALAPRSGQEQAFALTNPDGGIYAPGAFPVGRVRPFWLGRLPARTNQKGMR
jgi:hypothetical protein